VNASLLPVHLSKQREANFCTMHVSHTHLRYAHALRKKSKLLGDNSETSVHSGCRESKPSRLFVLCVVIVYDCVVYFPVVRDNNQFFVSWISSV
jgi:hypothetical protein